MEKVDLLLTTGLPTRTTNPPLKSNSNGLLASHLAISKSRRSCRGYAPTGGLNLHLPLPHDQVARCSPTLSPNFHGQCSWPASCARVAHLVS